MLERTAQARLRAELDAQQARHELEQLRLQHEHERQLAARASTERVRTEEKARTNNVVVGGTAMAAAVAGTATLALQTPENRRTAQAAMSIAGGALTAASTLAESGSTTRNLLLGLGAVSVGVAVVDFVRQKISESRGGIGVTVQGGRDCLVIRAVAPRSAAALAGLTVGDEIIRVDGTPVLQLGMTGACGQLRGEVGSPVDVGVRRPSMGSRELDLTLIRTPK